ncbi:MAG: cobalt-zinc-cadmium efflux system outer membrane protein [Verrucomicrobiales bacterium]
MIIPQYLHAPLGWHSHPILPLLGICLAVGLSSRSTIAQSSSTLRLSELPKAVQNNPSWQAAKFRIDEARGRLLQSGRLSNPEIEIEASHGTDFREGSFSVAFSQAFPLTARLDLEKAVSAKEVEMAEAEVREVLRQLLLEAQTTATEYLATTEQVALQEKRKAITSELTTFIAKAAAAGELPQLDVQQTRLESARADLQIRKLNTAANRYLNELRPLLGLTPDSELTLTGVLAAPNDESQSGTANAATHRPDYRAAQLALQAAETAISLEEARRREDITVGVFVQGERAEDAPEGLANEAFSGFRISIPLPIWNKNDGSVREKQAAAARLRGEAAALKNRIRNAAAAAHAELVSHRALFDEISKTLLPLAEQQVADLESVYRAGQGDLQSVLRAREQSLELESARLDALRDFHLARLRLAAIAPAVPSPSTFVSP